MKTAAIVMMSIGLWLMSSCTPEAITRVGFVSDIEPHSSGLTMMNVSGNHDSLHLLGSVNVVSGTVIVELTGPSDQLHVSDTLAAGETKTYNRIFGATTGYWKIHYRSVDGTGHINLHLASDEF